MDSLRRAFRDICAGYTAARILGRAAYIRHLTHADQVDIDEQRERFRLEAKAQGIPTDAERLIEARAAGLWTDEQESALERARKYVLELEDGKRQQAKRGGMMPSMVSAYTQRIKEAEADYAAKALAKRQAFGLTCEVSADLEVSDQHIVTSLYADPGLTRPLFTGGEFEHMHDQQVSEIVRDHNAAIDGCSERNLKALAMSGLFQRYFQLTGDDFIQFYGKPIVQLTFYQLDLLRHGAHFRHIYQTHDITAFPKHVQDDPDLLSDYARAVETGKKDLAAKGANEAGAMVVGMKPEDAKVMGVPVKNPVQEAMNHPGGFLGWAAAQAAQGGR